MSENYSETERAHKDFEACVDSICRGLRPWGMKWENSIDLWLADVTADSRTDEETFDKQVFAAALAAVTAWRKGEYHD